MGRVRERVPYEVCKARVLDRLRKQPPGYLFKASHIALFIWPGTEFLRAQGAGAAASRILKRMQKDGLVEWTVRGNDWGYRSTTQDWGV